MSADENAGTPRRDDPRAGSGRGRAAARAVALLLGAGTLAAACGSGGPSGTKATTTTAGAGATTITSGPPVATGTTGSGQTGSGQTGPGQTGTTPVTTTTAPAVAPPAGGPVPRGFQPASATFVSPGTGFVLGAARSCGARCLALVRTEDGGTSWAGLAAPPARYVPANESGSATGTVVSEVRFADPLDGWAFGPGLFATHDGGRTWKAIGLSGAVVSLETSDRLVEAVVSPCAEGTTCTGSYRLVQAPAGGGAWRTVLTGPSQQAGAADAPYLSLQQGSGFVMLGNAYGPTGGSLPFYATGDLANPHGWHAFPNPCAGTGLDLTSFVAPDTKSLYSLCTGDPGAGNTAKELSVTVDGRTRAVGRPPSGGDGGTVTATAGGVVVIASSSAASMLYRSTDRGSHWSTAAAYSDGGEGLFDLGFTTSTQGFVVHALPDEAAGVSSTFLMTHDAGRTWHAVRF